jgi:hypothetical protein
MSASASSTLSTATVAAWYTIYKSNQNQPTDFKDVVKFWKEYFTQLVGAQYTVNEMPTQGGTHRTELLFKTIGTGKLLLRGLVVRQGDPDALDVAAQSALSNAMPQGQVVFLIADGMVKFYTMRANGLVLNAQAPPIHPTDRYTEIRDKVQNILRCMSIA